MRVDVGGFGDNSRNLQVLPDGRVLLAGGGRLTSSDVDGLVTILTPDGKPDTTFSPTGWVAKSLGGTADFLWAVSLSPDQKTVAFAGIGANPAQSPVNDDGVLLLMSLGR